MKRNMVAGAAMVAGLIAFGIASWPPRASATVQGSTFTTSPVSAVLQADPGQSISTDLHVQNNGTVATTLTVHAQKFTADGTTGQAQLLATDSTDASLGWVHFSKNSFVAEPGAWTTVVMTMNVPASAAFGYYYAAVFAPQTASGQTLGANTLRGANAVLVLLHVRTASEKIGITMTGFTADRGLYQYLPATFSVNIQNTGDVFIAPRGTIYISRGGTSPVIDTLAINQPQGNVLPGTHRLFAANWSNGFPSYSTKRVGGQVVADSQGKPVQELQWDTSKLTHVRFGRYEARVVMVYNNGLVDVPLVATVSFWVIPWLPLLIGIVLIGLIGFGFFSVVRLLWQRPVKSIRRR